MYYMAVITLHSAHGINSKQYHCIENLKFHVTIISQLTHTLIRAVPPTLPVNHFNRIHNLWQGEGKAVNPLNTELNPVCHLLALLGAHHILHVSRIRVKQSPPMCTVQGKTYS
jgi:hypothetical protein